MELKKSLLQFIFQVGIAWGSAPNLFGVDLIRVNSLFQLVWIRLPTSQSIVCRKWEIFFPQVDFFFYLIEISSMHTPYATKRHFLLTWAEKGGDGAQRAVHAVMCRIGRYLPLQD